MQTNFTQPLESNEVLYFFVIQEWKIFQSHSYRRYLKLVFHLWNENESFEVDQLFELYENDTLIHHSYDELIDQFRQFDEVNDEVQVNDLLGEKGTCYITRNTFNGKTYDKIVLTSWEGNGNE